MAKSPRGTKGVLVYQTHPLTMLQSRGKWFMIFIVGGYYQTTHINPTLMTSMGKLKEGKPYLWWPPHPPWWLEFKSWSTLICMKHRRLLMAKRVLNEFFFWPTISKGLYCQVFSTFNGKFEGHLTIVSWVLLTTNQTSNLFLR